ncbi:MAG: lactate racemase domain-containing protein [Christensenellaceae bacterium]|nr:lactate racemase domain-containing protein [Christensenellaceae bacterium]
MNAIETILNGIELPKMFRIRQQFKSQKIEDVPAKVIEGLLRAEIAASIQPNRRICLTCSSRGVDNLALVLRTVAGFCKQKGALPFIVPAMGSHGGATAEGQLEIANSYGVTEEYCGCPIISCMDTVNIGKSASGTSVFIDKYAAQADGIIVIGRVKPHTCFTGPFESGIMKMMAIGLGKQYGASVCHEGGFGEMSKMIREFGQTILANTNVLFALALVENAYDKTCIIKALTREEIDVLEPELLEKAKALMPRILFDTADVLVVDQIGKDISGDGMDPNIVGRWTTPYKSGGISAQRVVVLDVTEKSHGNVCGAGMADIGTMRIFKKMRFEMTYPNLLTGRNAAAGFLPIFMESDRLAMQAAVQTSIGVHLNKLRLIRIKDTLHMDEIELSEAYMEEAAAHPQVEILNHTCYPLPFDEKGNLF